MIFEDISYLLKNYWSYYLIGTVSTIILSLAGTFVALFLGIFLALGKDTKPSKNDPWYRKLWAYPVSFLCNTYSLIIRGTPMMVQAMIFKYGCQAIGINWNLVLTGVPVFDGWLVAGLIIIVLNNVAYMGEVIKTGLNGVDVGQTEGARSLGMSKWQTLWYITLPQALRNSIPTIGIEWVANIKDSSVLNVIGVTELFFTASDAASKTYKYIATYLIIAIIYLILCLIANGILKLVESKLDGVKFKFSIFHYNPKRGIN